MASGVVIRIQESGLRIFRWLKFVLAVVGFLTLSKYGLIFVLHSMGPDPDDDVSITVYPSPSGQYSAARVTRSGGGAIAPFCSDAVIVFNGYLNVRDFIARPEYEVYSAECDDFFDHESSPKIQWDSGGELRVDFAIGSTRLYSRKVDLRATDASGSVQVKIAAYR